MTPGFLVPAFNTALLLLLALHAVYGGGNLPYAFLVYANWAAGAFVTLVGVALLVRCPDVLTAAPAAGPGSRRFSAGRAAAVRTVTLVIVMAVAAGVYFYRLDERDLYGDEYLVAGAAIGYLKGGSFHQWDYIHDELAERHYPRAWPHTWMVAQAYRLFGINEWSSRVVSALGGLLFLLLAYRAARTFAVSHAAALLLVVLLMLHPELIELFRFNRMYAIFIPLFTVLFVWVYRALTNRRSSGWIYLGLSLLLTVFVYEVHLNGLVILPVGCLFTIYLLNTRDESRYFVIGLVCAGGIVASFYLVHNDLVHLPVCLFCRSHTVYLKYLTDYPFGTVPTLALWALGLASLFTVNRRAWREPMVYALITIGFSLFFYVYLGDRYSLGMYVSHIMPVAVAFSLVLFLRLIRRLSTPRWQAVFLLVLLAGAVRPYIATFQRTYGDQHIYAYPSQAFRELIDRYNPEREVIFGQYLRTHYLDQLSPQTRTISLLNNRRYPFHRFLFELKRHPRGWVVWETRKAYHIHPGILRYVRTHFDQVAGSGVDDHRMEIYHYDLTSRDASRRRQVLRPGG